MIELLALLAKYGPIAAKYGGLVVEGIQTLTAAADGKLTEEQVLEEVARIKAKEREQVKTDWDIVNS